MYPCTRAAGDFVRVWLITRLHSRGCSNLIRRGMLKFPCREINTTSHVRSETASRRKVTPGDVMRMIRNHEARTMRRSVFSIGDALIFDACAKRMVTGKGDCPYLSPFVPMNPDVSARYSGNL